MRSLGMQLSVALCILSLGCGSDDPSGADPKGATEQPDSEQVCLAEWEPVWHQESGANEWWVEYTVQDGSAAAASLEVIGVGTVQLTSSWNKWVGSSSFRIPTGTQVVMHAQSAPGESAQTYPFAYLVVTAPATDPCAGSVCVPACANRACGDDGCGGLCGSCSSGLACQNGACVEGCSSGWTPNVTQGPGANNWWVEYTISGSVSSARLEVVGRGDVALSLSWNKWAGPLGTAVATGAPVILHATDTSGHQAQTAAFGYLTNSQPKIDTCGDSGSPPPVPSPAPPADADVVFAIDANATRTPISAYIYGTNTHAKLVGGGGMFTLGRTSGNRYSTYNWETNASNAGIHWQNANDGSVNFDGLPAAPARRSIEAALAVGASTIITVPTMGWAAGDMNGVVQSWESRDSRFDRSSANKGAPLASTPNLNDGVVFQDEFINYLSVRYPQAFSTSTPRVFFCLDNEPSLWNFNHPSAYFDPPRISAILTNNVTYARMIKRVQPSALVLGPVLYGWDAFIDFQGAVDRYDPPYANRTFLEVYLSAMANAEASDGKRLLDALDIHWYPEARGDGIRITSPQASSGLITARMQAPRSLWDPTYVEDSWITHDKLGGAPIRLLPWLKGIISRNYPGTKLVISEYNYGGGGHISGAVAEADVLGIFGRYGVFGASLWDLGDRDNPYIYAGMAMYRNYDGQGGRFGDLSLPASTSNVASSSVYASAYSRQPGRIALVVINKSYSQQVARIELASSQNYQRGTAFVVTSSSPQPRPGGVVTNAGDGVFFYTMPPMSVSTLVISQ